MALGVVFLFYGIIDCGGVLTLTRGALLILAFLKASKRTSDGGLQVFMVLTPMLKGKIFGRNWDQSEVSRRNNGLLEGISMYVCMNLKD